MGIVIGFLLCPKCFLGLGNMSEGWRHIIMSITYTYILGYGCSYISYKVAQRYYQGEKPIKGFLINLVILALYSFFTSMLIWYFSIRVLYNPDFNPSVTELVSNAYIALALSMFFSGIEFLKKWKSEAVKAERLEKEKIATQYESLRNQVNPHFLFNSLNTLTSLVVDSQDLAIQYINQLSEVYRYVLDSRNKDVVGLDVEVDFLKSYLFLQKIRFGENISVDIRLKDDLKDKFILPLSLQILMENAIKHNEISSEKPLKISVVENDDYIKIENQIHKKQLFEKGSGIGLNNIMERYQHLTDKEISIINDNKKFVVQLPIIKEVK